MKFGALKIIPIDLLPAYKAAIPKDLRKRFKALRESPLSTRAFSFYTSISAIASSRIEGEPMEVDSYVKHRMLKIAYLPDLVQKPNDLYKAYQYAQTHPLNRKNFLQSHKLLGIHLLPRKSLGALRKTEMVVVEHQTHRIQYEAAPAGQVPILFDLLWGDIKKLVKMELTMTEAFFMAASIHLIFVNIHPFEDGNGRVGRLLEKWFLSEKLGQQAWYLQSEYHYYQKVDQYYKNLNRMGIFYQDLDYSKSLPFLLILPASSKLK